LVGLCLTAAQVRVARAYYPGPTDRRGGNLFDGGLPYGSELAWQGWAVQPASDTVAPADTFSAAIGLSYLRHLAFWRNPPVDLGLRDVQVTASAHRRLQEVGDIYDATDPDLRAFAARGGKADQAIPPIRVPELLPGRRSNQRRHQGQDVLTPVHDPRAVSLPLRHQLQRRSPNRRRPDDSLDPKGRGRRSSGSAHDPGHRADDQVRSAEPHRHPLRSNKPAARNNGLNSNYNYLALRSTYRPDARCGAPRTARTSAADAGRCGRARAPSKTAMQATAPPIRHPLAGAGDVGAQRLPGFVARCSRND
jgi:hypothetical protein